MLFIFNFIEELELSYELQRLDTEIVFQIKKHTWYIKDTRGHELNVKGTLWPAFCNDVQAITPSSPNCLFQMVLQVIPRTVENPKIYNMNFNISHVILSYGILRMAYGLHT